MGSAEASVVVAIDFGTTFSGFAFAHKNQPSKIYFYYQWPETSGDQCKTNTQLYYSKQPSTGQLALQSWGAKALKDYTHAKASSGELITKFKLHLAGKQYGPNSANPLPRALSTDQVITDYLREISTFCMKHLKETYGEDEISCRDVQWLLTVPAIWDDQAKQRMKACAEAAGMVQGRKSDWSGSEGSPHPLGIILEPEAAAVYCLSQPTWGSKSVTHGKGDKFLTADLGGGTVDLVIHEKVWNNSGKVFNLEIREVAKSSGGLCGSTYVDEEFIKHLRQRIPCFNSFAQRNPITLVDNILRWWDCTKKGFDGTVPHRWSIPATLAEAWKLDDKKAGRTLRPNYNDMNFTKEDLISIFEPVVKKVIEHIEEALSPFAPGEVKSIMAVGGFSSNRYLRKRLNETFKPRLVKAIVTPPNPSGAICEGAVMLGIAHKDLIVSRVSRKTYGQSIVRNWTSKDPVELQYENDEGVLRCKKCFEVFVRMGEVVPSDHFVTSELTPEHHGQKSMTIQIYSCDTVNPEYVNEEGVVKEGEFKFDISSALEMDKDRRVAVTMYFGRSSIEVKAKGVNFEASGGTDEAIPVAFKGGRFANVATVEE